MELAELIVASHPYLSCFDYDHYPSCFAQFEAAAEPLFAALHADRAEQEALALLDALERRYAALARRERKEACFQDKQVLALFLSPAALRRGGEAAAFAGQLCEQWKRRFPGEPYRLGEFETIMKGFDANLLGLPLRKSKKR